MNFINTILGTPLGYILYFCYSVVGSYGWAIILFTLLTKVLLFPLSLIVQKNSVKMVKLQPQLDEINIRYAGDKDKIAEEQIALYKKEKYSPAAGCAPALLQIPLIIGLINVIYNPLQHLLHFGEGVISVLGEHTLKIMGLEKLGSGAQLQIANAILQHPEAFEPVRGSVDNFDAVIASVLALDFNFFGIDLSAVPSISSFSILLLIPLFAGVSTAIMCVSQNYMNVLQKEQSVLNKWGMAIFLSAFSVYFAFLVPAGVGLYWIAGNLLSILVMIVCNMCYDPRKYIDYENRSQKPQLSKEEKAKRKEQDQAKRQREGADSKRFYANENKELVFYSAAGGFYKYFKHLIAYVTNNSDIVVHYVTSDNNDPIFKNDNKQIVPYYIGEKALIPFMMKMDADMVVMTLPDLGQYHIKRSLVRKDVEYIYTDHGMASFHLMLREGALDYFDTIFCYGQNQMDEVRATERFYQLNEKKLVKAGYGLLDTLLDNVAALPRESDSALKKILIAPSWQKDNILELCLAEVVEQLAGKGYRLIIRPHPEFIKRFPLKMEKILRQYENMLDDDFVIDLDFSSNESIFTSDLVITDWSAIAQEFSYSTKKPSLFINTPLKVMNPEYKRIGITPLEFSLRKQIGIALDVDGLSELHRSVDELLGSPGFYRAQIEDFMSKNVFFVGDKGKAGGDYIIQAIGKKRQADG